MAFFNRRSFLVILVAMLIGIAPELLGAGSTMTLATTSLAIIALSYYIGLGTEKLVAKTNPKIGSLLNATLGNAAELIISIVALVNNKPELVLASLAGSIIGNKLFVSGMSMFVGGLKNGEQTFDASEARHNNTVLRFVVAALVVTSLLGSLIDASPDSTQVEEFHLWVAGILIVVYLASLTQSVISQKPVAQHPPHGTPWPLKKSIAVLALSTAGIGYISEILVSVVEPAALSLGMSEFPIGFILIPTVGNIAEHASAIVFAYRNQMELSLGIAVESAKQIALFVAPALVFVGYAIGHPLQLTFNSVELIAMAFTVFIGSGISYDGRSNWSEGVVKLGFLLIILVYSLYLPAH